MLISLTIAQEESYSIGFTLKVGEEKVFLEQETKIGLESIEISSEISNTHMANVMVSHGISEDAGYAGGLLQVGEKKFFSFYPTRELGSAKSIVRIELVSINSEQATLRVLDFTKQEPYSCIKLYERRFSEICATYNGLCPTDIAIKCELECQEGKEKFTLLNQEFDLDIGEKINVKDYDMEITLLEIQAKCVGEINSKYAKTGKSCGRVEDIVANIKVKLPAASFCLRTNLTAARVRHLTTTKNRQA